MRSPSYLIGFLTAILFLLSGYLPAIADTRIRGEFEYSIDDATLSEWQIGPAFALDDATELEVPLGQEDEIRLIKPELSHEIEANDLTIEFSIGIEAPFTGEPIEGFGEIEGRVDF